MKPTKGQWEFIRKRLPKEHGEGRRRHDAKRILEGLVRHLQGKGKIDLAETFIDASFVEEKRG